jgi:amino acid transporter
MAGEAGAPRESLAVTDVVAIVVGIVIGVGIFKTPAMVAANTGSGAQMLLAWLLGGAASLAGALCYAELASTYPHTGGEYHFLTRAFGQHLAFLFAWARMVVLQTGTIALLAIVLGDYASQLATLGHQSSGIYAALVILLMTWVNLRGLQLSKWAQKALALILVLGLVAVIATGLSVPVALASTAASNGHQASAFGLAMVFVLLTYGGWNEAAYISAEVHDVRRNMMRALVASIAIITVLCLLVNLAYLKALGIDAMSRSNVVAADLMRAAFGEGGADLVSLLIVIATLSSINVTMLTGARANYAMALDFPLFSFLGRWQPRTNAPANALLLQGGIALLLVWLGSLGRSGFEAMVEYLSPVFWLFFLLTGLSLFVLRWREPTVPRPFRVPLYPLTPLLFCLTCAYMLYSSLAYTGFYALVGVAVLGAGLPLWFFMPRRLGPPARQARIPEGR